MNDIYQFINGNFDNNSSKEIKIVDKKENNVVKEKQIIEYELKYDDNKVIQFLDSIFRKEFLKIFIISLLFTIFSFLYLFIKVKNYYPNNWFFTSKIIFFVWFSVLVYLLMLRLEGKEKPVLYKMLENKYYGKIDTSILNFLNIIIWSDKTYGILTLVVILLFIMHLIKYRKLETTKITNTWFLNPVSATIFLITFFFSIYFSLIPATNDTILFLKKRNNQAICTYITATLTYFGLPLPVYWISNIFPAYNLTI